MNWVKRNYAEDASVSVLERISYLCGNAGNCIGLAVIATYMLFYYTDILGISAGAVATIMLISRVFDGITDIIMGYIIDRTHSPKGKARVWLLRGCVPYMVAVAGMFYVPSGVSDVLKYVYIFVFYNLANAVFGTVVNTSYNSMNSLITKNSYETGVLGIFGMIGTTVATTFVGSYTLKIIGLFGEGEKAWHMGIAVVALVGLALLLICYFGVRERVVESQEEKETRLPVSKVIKNLVKNKYWVMVGISYIFIMFFGGLYTSSLLYYCKGVLGDVSYQSSIMSITSIAQLVSMICAIFFVKKFGKGNTFRIGNIVLIAAFVFRMIVGANPQLQIFGSVLYGVGYGIAVSEILGLLADTVEYGLWKTGVRIVGSAFAVMSFAAKIGNGFGSSIVGWIIDWCGYDANAAVQSAKAVAAINACFIYIPLVCVIIMMIIMVFYDLDKKFDSIMADNKERAEKKSSC